MEMDIKIKHISFFLTLNVNSQYKIRKILAFEAFKSTESLEAQNTCYINLFIIFIVVFTIGVLCILIHFLKFAILKLYIINIQCLTRTLRNEMRYKLIIVFYSIVDLFNLFLKWK